MSRALRVARASLSDATPSGTVHDVPLDALSPLAELVLHMEMCGWCGPYAVCSVARPLEAAVNDAYGVEMIHAAA